MSRRVIINADDFGLSPGVSRGIVSAFRDGILTSTTMMINLDYFDDAVALAKENPDLPVGIHLSLLWGPPVSAPDKVPTLVDDDGLFPRSLGTLARRYFTGRLSRADVRTELGNQIRAFLDAGLVPTHVDTHKHVHCLPGVLDALIEAARELGVRRVRLPRETPLGIPGRRPSWTAAAKRNVIRTLSRQGRRKITGAGLGTTDHFVGIDYQNDLDSSTFLDILAHLPEGTTEIMCHPGTVDEPMMRYSRIPPHRERELAGLKDEAVEDYVASAGIELIHYGAL